MHWLHDIFNSGLDTQTTTPWVLRRHRTINVFLLTFLPVALPYAPAYWLLGLRASAVGFVIAALLSQLLLLVLRRTQNTRLVAHLAVALLTVTFSVSLVDTGGLHTASIAWMAVLPLIAGLMEGRRASVLWGGVSLLVVLGVAGGHALELIPPPLTGPLYLAQSVLGLGGCVVVVVVVLRVFDDQNKASEREASQTVALLQQEVESRREAEQGARQALEVRSNFLAMMSHEVRTPLNAVLGMNQLLLDTELDAQQVDLVETSSEAGKSLLVVLNDILDLSKLEAGRVTLEEVPVDLHRLVRELTTLHRGNAAGKGLVLLDRIGADVPQWVKTDPTRLRQVLNNLLSNGVKFTQQGRVDLHVLRDDGRIRFEVFDTGVGIPEEALEHVFDPFTQAEGSTTRRFGGTGLGLAISAQLVRRMGGELQVESVPGEGASFHFHLDLPETQAPARRASTRVTLPEGVRLLVAEDNPVNQKLVRMLLTRAGADFRMANNGREAWELARIEPFDLILMDLSMPEMDGFEATERIQALPDPPPIIALTANAFDEDRRRCEQLGMVDFLPKPFNARTFYEVISRWTAPLQDGESKSA